MSTDDLDTRIRALVRDAVSAAPAVPDLPTGAPEVEPRRDRRRAVWAGIGIAAAIVAVAVLVTTHDRDPRIVAGSTSSDTPTTAPAVHTPWPDGVAVLVASDRGIERISGEKGEAVVTRLFSAAPTSRAIELENGSIVYQRTGGDIDVLDASLVPGNQALVTGDGTGSTALEDADAPLGSLRLVYRGPATDVSSALSLGTWFQPDEPRYAALPGGFGVGYRRFSIVDDRSVVAATVDDTGQRGAFTVTPGEDGHVAPEYVSPYLVVGDGAGSVAALGADGRVVLSGARSGVIAALDDPATVTDLDLRGDWLVVRRVDGSSTLVHTTDGARFDVPVASGVVMLARSAPPSTPPTSTTLLPTTSAEPFPNCLTVTATAVADVQLDSVLSSLDPIPEEPITVAGRPAILQTWGSGYGVVFRQPDSCTEYSMTTMTMSKGGLLAWLAGVSVTEQLPPDMPTVLLRSSFGLSVVGPSGTKAVARVPVDQALLLADGRVVYHSSELADFQMWDPATDTSEAIWAAADFAEQPVLQDAYGSSFVYSVGDRLYSYDTDQTWPLTGPPAQRISVFGDGELASAVDAPTAMDPSGELQAVVLPGGEVSVVRVADGTVLYRSIDSDVTVTDVDVNHGWLVVAEILPGDSPSRVTMVELATGRALRFLDVAGAHLG